MAVLNYLSDFVELDWPALLLGALLAYYIVPYMVNLYELHRFPGPLVARFSNIWTFYYARQHQLSLNIHKQHKKYGDFVRLSPTHVSISHPDSIKDVLGHGNGFLKSDFYYAFDNIEPGIFTTRDRQVHSRKRKYVAHMFSPKAMVNFEPYMTNAISMLSRQMVSLIDTGVAGSYESLDRLNPGISQRKREGEAAVDAVAWAAFLAFDIIGDLAFGEAFGFAAAGCDKLQGIKKLRDRGEWCATVGQMPWIKLWTPYFFFDSFFQNGLKAAQGLARIGIASVEKRQRMEKPDRKDILYYLLTAKDPDTGKGLPDNEIKAEALTQLIAGSDTTGNTISHIIDMLTMHPEKLKKLTDELDAAFPSPLPEDFVAMFDHCKDLPYLSGVIHETLRLRTTVSLGLPRAVAKGGATVCGEFFKEGTVLSTPTYTVHRDPRVWGKDALEFKPERWMEDDTGYLEKNFLGFSYGPRACIGRNVAFMELKKTVATLFRRFNYRPVYPEKGSYIREGFHFKVQQLPVFVKQRG